MGHHWCILSDVRVLNCLYSLGTKIKIYSTNQILRKEIIPERVGFKRIQVEWDRTSVDGGGRIVRFERVSDREHEW
jgi:hypothetical protein